MTVTSLAISAVILSPTYKYWNLDHSYVGIVLGVLAVILLYAMYCYPMLCQKVPTNYILLSLFTLCESYFVSYIASNYATKSIWISATAVLCTVLA